MIIWIYYNDSMTISLKRNIKCSKLKSVFFMEYQKIIQLQVLTIHNIEKGNRFFKKTPRYAYYFRLKCYFKLGLIKNLNALLDKIFFRSTKILCYYLDIIKLVFRINCVSVNGFKVLLMLKGTLDFCSSINCIFEFNSIRVPLPSL